MNRIEIASAAPATVGFIWCEKKPDTGLWYAHEFKTVVIARMQKCYPGQHQVRGQLLNHIVDVFAFRASTQHPGLLKAVDNFLEFAKKREWTGWMYPVDDLPPIWGPENTKP